MEPDQTQSSTAIPIAIVVGFAMIALAIFFTNRGNDTQVSPITVVDSSQSEEQVSVGGNIRPVDGTDYIRGNPNAPILLIEYSDYDCPFCKEFHDTMNRVMDEFGADGQVSWVYRQYPLEQLHPNSPRVSEAALCVGDIGGNSAFWQFTDQIFEQRGINSATNVVLLPEYAERAGVDRDAYNNCMESRRMQQAVLDSLKDGFDAGIRSTPITHVVAGNQKAVIEGARSYETVREIVVSLVEQLEGTFESEESTEEAISDDPPTDTEL